MDPTGKRGVVFAVADEDQWQSADARCDTEGCLCQSLLNDQTALQANFVVHGVLCAPDGRPKQTQDEKFRLSQSKGHDAGQKTNLIIHRYGRLHISMT